METIIDYVRRRLRDTGPDSWELIAEVAGVAKSLPRKIVYGDRINPGVMTIQPLVTFFRAVDQCAEVPDAHSSTPSESSR